MRRIIRHDLVRQAHRGPDGVATIQLSENGVSARLKRVQVRGVPDNGYVIDLDGATCTHGGASHRFPQFSGHFDRAAAVINKICDAVLVWEVEDRIKVAFVDLKSEAPQFSAAKAQLENSKKFLEYVHSLLVWRDAEARALAPSLHIVMLDGSKARAGGRRVGIDYRDYVGIHGVTVDRHGTTAVRWHDFFA